MFFIYTTTECEVILSASTVAPHNRSYGRGKFFKLYLPKGNVGPCGAAAASWWPSWHSQKML